MERPPKLLYTIPEACHALSLGRSKVYELIQTGELRSVHVDRKHLIPVAALHEFVARLEANTRTA